MTLTHDNKKATFWRKVLLSSVAALPLLGGWAATQAEEIPLAPVATAGMSENELLTQRLLAASTTDYTRQLFDLSREYTPLLEKDGITRVVLLDPDRFYGLLATSEIDAEKIVQNIARGNGVTLADALVEKIADSATEFDVEFENDPGVERREPSPVAARALPDTPAEVLPADTCVVVAAGHELRVVPVGYFDPDEAALYANRHEFWHCMDKFMDRQITDFKSASMQAAYENSFKMRREAFADVGAAGDMIAFDGLPVDYVINNLVKFRTDRALIDPEHFSTPALEALGNAIGAMGLESFTAMSPEKRKKFYIRVTMDNSLSGPEVMMLSAAPGKGADDADIAKFDENIRKSSGMRFLAKSYHTYYSEAAEARMAERPVITPMPTAMNTDERSRFDTWDAQKSLLEKAAKLTGDVDAESLAHARADILNEIRRDQDAHPSTRSQFFPAMEAKLETAFTDIMMEMLVYKEEKPKEAEPAVKQEPAATVAQATPPTRSLHSGPKR